MHDAVALTISSCSGSRRLVFGLLELLVPLHAIERFDVDILNRKSSRHLVEAACGCQAIGEDNREAALQCCSCCTFGVGRSPLSEMESSQSIVQRRGSDRVVVKARTKEDKSV